MSKIVRYEFLGSWVLFWVLCFSIIGLPVALLYLVNGTVRVEDDMEDPEQFLQEYRSGKWRRR
jgi:hypothetical protein